MDFKIETNVELSDWYILDVVNDFQEDHNLEIFDTVYEIPKELIYMCVMEDILDVALYELEVNRFSITKIN